MIIKLCSKPQQFNAVTPTPPALCSHSFMRARALGHDNMTMHCPAFTTVESERKLDPGLQHGIGRDMLSFGFVQDTAC